MSTSIRIGISSCLLGEKVRYDGGHKRVPYIARMFGRCVEWVPVCPEVGIGLGVPRAPIHLINRGGTIRAAGREDDALDVTDALAGYGKRMSHSLGDVSAYVFKARSPSCGLNDVPISQGGRVHTGRGIYADAFLQVHPGLPAIDEADLADPELRDGFIERVFAYRRWQDLIASGVSLDRLVEFHAEHKLALMAHSARAVSELGRLVADVGPIERMADKYFADFMRMLSQPTTLTRHKSALLQAFGYLKQHLKRRDRMELLNAIRRFHAGKAPRSLVLKSLRRHFRRHPVAGMLQQTYLYPSKNEQRLRRL